MDLKKCRVLCVLIALALVLGGCGPAAPSAAETERPDLFAPLDKSKVDTDTTDGGDRAEYYKEAFDDLTDDMSKEERAVYYVTLNLKYAQEVVPDDDLIFLRNDNVYKGDILTTDPDPQIKVPPGIYRVISVNAEQHDGKLGDIEILVPGEEVTLLIDYDAYTATVQRP